MERIQITCSLREGTGKEMAKKVRKQGFTPAVVYGGDVHLSVKVPLTSLKTLKSIHFS